MILRNWAWQRLRATDRKIEIVIPVVIAETLITRWVVTFKWSSRVRSVSYRKIRNLRSQSNAVGHQNYFYKGPKVLQSLMIMETPKKGKMQFCCLEIRFCDSRVETSPFISPGVSSHASLPGAALRPEKEQLFCEHMVPGKALKGKKTRVLSSDGSPSDSTALELTSSSASLPSTANRKHRPKRKASQLLWKATVRRTGSHAWVSSGEISSGLTPC